MSVPTPSPEQERRRERAVLVLAERGDTVGVLRLVTAWAEAGTPTAAARVAEGRALLALRLVDRAIARAREGVERQPNDRAALRLLAEAYLDRGWPSRARGVLDTLRMAGEDVEALARRLGEEPPRPEATAAEVEASGDAAARLRLAEQFLAAGSTGRATTLLARLAVEVPADPRVRDLRWGLGGDFRGPEPLELMVKRALPAILELDAVPRADEHTESIGAEGDLVLTPDISAAPFPLLFKVSESDPPDTGGTTGGVDDEEERTAHSAVTEAPRAPEPAAGGPGDTQILRVVGDEGPLHRRRDDGLRTLNLREWQASMGVDPVASDLDDDDPSEELRGDDQLPLVEVAARVAAPPPSDLTDDGAPIEVVEKHPVPAVRAGDTELSLPPLVDDGPPRARLPEPEPPSGRQTLVRVVLGAGLLFAVVVVLGLLVAMIARATGVLDAARAEADVARALGSGDYPALVEAEARLGENAEGPIEAVELARLRVVLWAEYHGDKRLQDQVDALIANPEGVDAGQLAYLRAAELYAFGNPASALAAIGRAPPADDEARLCLARVHAALGDEAGAMADLAGLVAPDEPRYRVGRAQVLMALGKRAEARAVITLLLSEAPNHVPARLVELQLREGTPAERAAAADVFRKTYGALGLAPRQVGEAAWVEAQAWLEAGDRARALRVAEAAVAKDGTHRSLLLLLAAEDVLQAEYVLASRKLVALQGMYRADPAVQEALVLTYLELDRIEEARAVARVANPPMQATLDALVYAWSGEAGAPDVLAVDASTPLGAWAQALLAVNARRDDARFMAERAAESLAASADPLHRRLAPRAQVLAATLQPEAVAAKQLAALRRSGMADAGAHVVLARHLERTGARVLAAQHFDRAAELEPELGLALYERGRFYSDAQDPLGRTAEAWRSYLELAPSGPRAALARGVVPPTPD